MASTSGSHLSKEFFELIKAIGESRSKQEEDRIIAREVVILKNKLNPWKKQSNAGYKEPPAGGMPIPHHPPSTAQNPNFSSKKKAKEFLVRLLYVEMMGHDGSFGYIKAVEMAASTNITHKRVGYLLCGSCLSPENEFRFMLVNQMQRDLNSSNVLENCAALLAVTRIITNDMVPAVCGDVGKLLTHASETVRKKAIVALHRLHQLNSEAVPPLEFIEKLRRVLCDRDPAVMGASLCVIESMAQSDPMPFKDLVSSLVSILKQICEHRLPSDFDYHRMPAPWMQMQILRILAILGKGDAAASSDCYEVISDCLKRADIGANAGYAVVYECVRTITKIYPNNVLLDSAAESISRFIDSRSHNLKYLGVTGLASIVEQHPQYAAAHQMAVIECLEDRDETLQRKTLELLYKMTNPINVEFITDKLLVFLRDTTDPFLKKDLTLRITKIAERYAPSQEWYVRSITQLFEISGDLVSPDVATNLMSLIAEGEEDDDEEANMTLRQNAVELYASLLENPNRKLPKTLAETVAWVLGEYAYLSAEYDLSDILTMLCDFIKRGGGGALSSSSSTKRFLVSAIMKLVAQLGTCPPCAAHVIDDYTKSNDVDLQQRCLEFQNLLTSASHVLAEILPVDASCEDVEADEGLSYLDNYVAEAVANGAMPYSPPEDDDEDDDVLYGGVDAGGRRNKPTINVTPYEKPKTPGEAQIDLSRKLTVGSGTQYGSAPHGGTGNSGFSPTRGDYGGSSAGQAGGRALGGSAGGGGGGGGGGAAAGVGTAEPQLNVRNVAHVWGKPAPAPTTQVTPATATAPPGGVSVGGPTGNSTGAVATGGGYAPAPGATGMASGYGGGGAPSGPYGGYQPQESDAPKEMSEKEKMAAALFGGIVPGAAAPTPSTSNTPPRSTSAAAAGRAASRASAASKLAAPAAAPPAAPPAPVAAPPAPAVAPEVDLLDMMSFGDAPAPASSAASVSDGLDVLAPTPVTAAPPAPASDPTTAEPSPATASAAAAAAADPFAAEGLLSGLSDKPLNALPSADVFRHEQNSMTPLTITTAEFGQMWGSTPHTHPLSVVSQSQISNLSQLMDLFLKVGAHSVETIAATNEGIAAGNVGESIKVLLHGKVQPQITGGTRVDVILKSSDAAVVSNLAAFLSNRMA